MKVIVDSSLLVQVLNNRMFETRDAKRLEEEIVEGEPADKTFGFQLPEDEPGQVRMMVVVVMVLVRVMVMAINCRRRMQ